MVKPLTIYKASAGSGKTFTLAVEYITLLIENPTSYRNILAVTFTNKATEEMKMRILSQLHGIARQLPDSDIYLQRVCEKTGLDRTEVSRRARTALRLLLHNYNYFRVETIDSFFQSVLRNLARELDLTANMRISLNDGQVEEQAVDQLIDSLKHEDLMLKWLLSYIMEKINDDHSWNIIGQVKKFGKTIFRDYYKAQSATLKEKVGQQGFIDHYTQQLKGIKADALQHMQQYATQFFDTLAANDVNPDELMYGKSGILGFFLKLQQGKMDESIVGSRVNDCRNDPDKWYKKGHEKAELIHQLAASSLIDLLERAIKDRPRQWLLYQSADVTLRHLSQLRLLGSIEQKVRDLNSEANRFLLSDTQQLLHALISDSDSPFIFEKIGSQLEHIMIDEFQDTSTVQWQNFKVLLEECMSHRDTTNLLVGDVKQSIYRWRSGDWRLLNAIDQQFDHAAQRLHFEPLNTNYRSERNIIAFNNAFFTEAARQEYEQQRTENPAGAQQLQHAYEDVEQKWKEGAQPSGSIAVQLLTNDDYQERTLQLVANTVRKLQQQGVALADIAILVRSNKHIPTLAEYFSAELPDIPIVSDEAFRLDASLAVCLLVQALQLLIHPDDTLAKGTLAKLYQRGVLNNTTPENELLIRDRELDELLPKDFTEHGQELLQLPLYELVERLHHLFQLSRLENQSAYLCGFYDQLNKFAQDNTADVEAFLREWDESISGKTIQGDATHGVRILSINKSKGLEFPHVIIPFCDWRLELPDMLWCKPETAPFDALPLVPVDYSKNKLRGTIYEDDYLNEHLQNTVDNLNLLYVAFTRAISSLTVFGLRGAKNTRSALLEGVLPALNKALPECLLSGVDDTKATMTFEYAPGTTDYRRERKTQVSTENVFLKPVTPVYIQLETFAAKTEFRQSNRSRDFITGDDEQQELSYIKMGSILHEVFSTIRTTDDIEPALLRLQHEGIIYDDEVTREKLLRLLQQRLQDRRVSNWFSGGWQLFNECNIVQQQADGTLLERRPDRVMTNGRETHVVDFKFGRPQEEYHDQVREYMQLLSQMGMPQVHGWLWYVYSNKIEEVKA